MESSLLFKTPSLGLTNAKARDDTVGLLIWGRGRLCTPA
jgi:hypothetical protein